MSLCAPKLGLLRSSNYHYNLWYCTRSQLENEVGMSDALQQARGAFLLQLTETIKSHRRRRTFDAGLYQFLVIGSAIAGFASLAFGLAAHDHKEYAIWAG